ncbi:JAB1/Mov34/MPN/PAD-1 [Cynara cardunculus var. scolymus]|uniref:JAB1/Mov34/MPN/PAD-1 n=1 Tax=Cynara cardunculus var. scolymus TaxID=59895 RepID=A0A118JT53_CYNCS|nr:JAB1/Mov34/MPN/PAD-1 [Cynara cardunculus var. scolymus]
MDPYTSPHQQPWLNKPGSSRTTSSSLVEDGGSFSLRKHRGHGALQGKPMAMLLLLWTRLRCRSRGRRLGLIYEDMTDYSQTNNKQTGSLENIVGWYDSHPGYGCWLSVSDASTQMLNQQFQEPFLAVEIDPTRTLSAGKTAEKLEQAEGQMSPFTLGPLMTPKRDYQGHPSLILFANPSNFGQNCRVMSLWFHPEDVDEKRLLLNCKGV